jgi:hypothetical protein
MIIQLQFSEIMGCANMFQFLLTLAVYCVSTPSILLTRVHVTSKIKIKKITERIKNISELKCNIELEIRFKT